MPTFDNPAPCEHPYWGYWGYRYLDALVKSTFDLSALDVAEPKPPATTRQSRIMRYFNHLFRRDGPPPEPAAEEESGEKQRLLALAEIAVEVYRRILQSRQIEFSRMHPKYGQETKVVEHVRVTNSMSPGRYEVQFTAINIEGPQDAREVPVSFIIYRPEDPDALGSIAEEAWFAGKNNNGRYSLVGKCTDIDAPTSQFAQAGITDPTVIAPFGVNF